MFLSVKICKKNWLFLLRKKNQISKISPLASIGGSASFGFLHKTYQAKNFNPHRSLMMMIMIKIMVRCQKARLKKMTPTLICNICHTAKMELFAKFFPSLFTYVFQVGRLEQIVQEKTGIARGQQNLHYKPETSKRSFELKGEDKILVTIKHFVDNAIIVLTMMWLHRDLWLLNVVWLLLLFGVFFGCWYVI